jgi:hypothetical protein
MLILRMTMQNDRNGVSTICAEYIYEHLQNSNTVHIAIFINIIYRYMYKYYIYTVYIKSKSFCAISRKHR